MKYGLNFYEIILIDQLRTPFSKQIFQKFFKIHVFKEKFIQAKKQNSFHLRASFRLQIKINIYSRLNNVIYKFQTFSKV